MHINAHEMNVRQSCASFVTILYDDVLAGCGSADICKIDITSLQGGVYGFVYVDMTQHMKILSVHSWRPSEVDVRQIDSFNAVEVGYAAVKTLA